MIRSSAHSIKFANNGKLNHYSEFLCEYRRIFKIILDEVWDNGYGEFNVKNDKLKFQKYLDYNDFHIDTGLSARALSSLVTQLCGVVKASVRKRDKLLWLKEKLEFEGKSTKNVKENLHKTKAIKPNVGKINPELSSKNIEIIESKNSFDYWVKVKSIGKKYGNFYIPVKKTKVSEKWLNKGEMLNSVLLGDKKLNLRYKIELSKKENGIIVGADQGMKDVLTFSDGTVTKKCDNHNHSLESIINKLSKKKKGSKAFKKAQSHRKNFINWSINQLNFDNIKEIKLEKVVNINFGKRTNRKIQAWTNTLIRDKIKSKAHEQDVLVTEQDCTYRSQRCSSCGNVRKANRKSKIYKCKNCNHVIDADLNAAKNHEICLPDLPWDLRSQKLNLGNGFFWKPNGIFTFDGVELRVPLSSK